MKKQSSWGRIWVRWYSCQVGRRLRFRPFVHRKQTLLGSGSTLNTFWLYFNAPGNVLFVTTNLITLTGMVAYHSYISEYKDRFTIDRSEFPVAAGYPVEQRWLEAGAEEIAGPEVPIQKEQADEQTVNTQEADTEETLEAYETPFTEYDTVNVKKSKNVTSFNAYMAKISIFNLMYSYFLYKDVQLSSKTNHRKRFSLAPSVWTAEVNLLRNDDNSNSNKSTKSMPINKFYSLWRMKMSKCLESLQKVPTFSMPNWTHFPNHLKDICECIYNSKLDNIQDFEKLYHEIGDRSKDGKKLLRLWLYDNIMLINQPIYPHMKKHCEKFYNELLEDSLDDETLFIKYSSIMIDPDNSLKKFIFFPSFKLKDTDKIMPSVSLETLLNTLNGFVHLKETNNTKHYAQIIKLISMLKKDCVIAKAPFNHNSNTESGYTGVRILLQSNTDLEPNPNHQNLHNKKDNNHEIKNQDQRQKCFQIVSQNKQAVALLDKISSWKT